ncbi:DUF349 domain-containing protein [Saccharopolyspora sp. NFXS83]|uniref:DUF349 domain-containing protein n=1 Tax=Saccharopolyspora sp. NFXS83 TaxID=2993560 RepID=UPI00224A8918|nr:DUF349 domain-containing protein [Saccharopolyspora sp. NFXS83]MCX2730961.1 DUF349 domain-containing protein [Saccharopolyspora sp. NFXS83]
MTHQDTTPESTAGATPDAAAAVTGTGSTSTAPTVPAASANPDRWGRVDETGTVWVRTVDGERAVGSWQAGEPSDGLAHFARKFDDVRTEAELLEKRLSSRSGDAKQSLTSAQHLRDGLPEAAVVGDLEALGALVEHLVQHAEKAVEEAKAHKEQARTDAVARKEALAAEAEQIAAEATHWKSAGDRLRGILDEWKSVRGVDRKTDEQLWRRFSKARDAFNRRRGSHFADLDRQRAASKVRKQELVDEAESLTESTDWGATATRYKDLMAEWKASGRAPKDSDDALWQRFRSAQDAFFARRSAAFSERDAEFAENAKLKEALLTEAETIDPGAGLAAAQAHLQRIQQRWDEIGKVPRERMRELEGRLRTVADRVRSASDAQWRRTDPEAQARVDQFRERVEQFEAQAEKARVAGDEKRAKKADEQAGQWRVWLSAAEQALADR